MRLEKYVSITKDIPRSTVTKLLKNGSIKVNGTAIMVSCDIKDSDIVEVDGEVLEFKKTRVVMMYKPIGYVVSSSEKDGKSIYNLLKSNRLKPIGRLDKFSEGLLLLTDDGKLIHDITNPKSIIEKEYIVTCAEEISDELSNLSKEFHLTNQDRGAYIAKAKSYFQIDEHNFSITITEGKFHEVREITKLIGLTLTNLKRVRIGGIALDPSLNAGEVRELNNKEIEKLMGALR